MTTIHSTTPDEQIREMRREIDALKAQVAALEAALAQTQERIANACTHGYGVASGWYGRTTNDEK